MKEEVINLADRSFLLKSLRLTSESSSSFVALQGIMYKKTVNIGNSHF
jgi:hypothetical protein